MVTQRHLSHCAAAICNRLAPDHLPDGFWHIMRDRTAIQRGETIRNALLCLNACLILGSPAPLFFVFW